MTPEIFHNLFLKAANSKSGWVWAHGLCFQYTYCFINLVGGRGCSYLTKKPGSKAYGHCFIKYNDCFYDSENIQGQQSWKKLQSYMNKAPSNKIKYHRTLSGMGKLWLQTSDFAVCESIIIKIKQLYQEEIKNKETC